MGQGFFKSQPKPSQLLRISYRDVQSPRRCREYPRNLSDSETEMVFERRYAKYIQLLATEEKKLRLISDLYQMCSLESLWCSTPY